MADRRRMVVSSLVALILVTVSAAAVVVSSESNGPGSGAAEAGLTIVDIVADPSEALVDQNVEWSVVVEVMNQSQRGKGLLFTWDWDDGSYSVYHLKSVRNSNYAFNVQTHSWSEPGLYLVTVSVWDGFDPEQSKLHNVSDTLPIIVSEEVTSRQIDYYWYDMFNHPIGEWYDWRASISNEEFRLSDEYPYLYLWSASPPGNIWVYTFMRMDADANNLTEINMNENPEFLPYFGDPSVRGGNAELDWYLNYITHEEGEAKLGDAAMGYFDGWYVALNGTTTLDEQAAKAVLGITSAQFDDFDAWWTANSGDISTAWEEWMIHEAGPERLDIFWMYDYDLQFVFFEIDAQKVGDEVVLELDTISWGAEALMTRWLHEAFMPTEWYMEDMSLHAAISPTATDLTLDAAVQYAVHAYESLVDGSPCWVWEAMMQDYVLSGQPPFDNKSLYDRYWNWSSFGMLEYYNTAPGSAWYGCMMDYDYTPGAWNLTAGETLTFEWPAGEQLFIVHAPGVKVGGDHLDYTTDLENVLEVWAEMTVSYAEPMPSDAPEHIAIDTLNRTVTFVGPFDMWTWSKEQITHPDLASEWDRLGVLPRGVPYVEFDSVDPANTPPVANFTIEPPSGTVDTIFLFDASTSWDAQDPVELLETRWDWESDGVWDTGWNGTAHTPTLGYPIPAIYDITLQVRDSGGLTDEITWSLLVEEAPSNYPPFADFNVSPLAGDTETIFSFDATYSWDVEDSIAELLVRWDWQSDGVWDTGWTYSKVDTHVYSNPGTYVVTLEVMDTGGLVADKQRAIVVSAPGTEESSLTYKVYDLFGEDWGDWWTTRVTSAWDTDRALTTGAGSMTYLYDAFGDKTTGIIYTPYRWNIEGTMLPNLNVHEPMLMPVLGTPYQPGAEATVHTYFQYLTPSSYDDVWVPYWEGSTGWHTDYEYVLYGNDDGWICGTWINVTMNRAAALEWLGMGTGDDPVTWWAGNGNDYRADWSAWVLDQGNNVYDI
ncbi:MAG: hypothetical protein JSU93_00005, partial [Methanobacteriota archaeon]